MTRSSELESGGKGAVNPYEDEAKTEGKEKMSQLSATTCRVQVVAESLGAFSLFVAGRSVSTRAHGLVLSAEGRGPLPEEQ